MTSEQISNIINNAMLRHAENFDESSRIVMSRNIQDILCEGYYPMSDIVYWRGPVTSAPVEIVDGYDVLYIESKADAEFEKAFLL